MHPETRKGLHFVRHPTKCLKFYILQQFFVGSRGEVALYFLKFWDKSFHISLAHSGKCLTVVWQLQKRNTTNRKPLLFCWHWSSPNTDVHMLFSQAPSESRQPCSPLNLPKWAPMFSNIHLVTYSIYLPYDQGHKRSYEQAKHFLTWKSTHIYDPKTFCYAPCYMLDKLSTWRNWLELTVLPRIIFGC